MERWLKDVVASLVHLVFPHICAGCGSDVLDREHPLCLSCLAQLPATNFHLYPNNPVDKIFWGRLDIQHATALYYFTNASLIHRLLHQFKYKDQPQLAIYLGKQMGHAFLQSPFYQDIDALIPLPLFASRQRKRGYNQSAMLCRGISEVLRKPVMEQVVVRTTHTESQTRKGRVERWQNMEGRFELAATKDIQNRHLLLVDDVITTGATLESCGRCLLEAPGVKVSVATLCYSTR